MIVSRDAINSLPHIATIIDPQQAGSHGGIVSDDWAAEASAFPLVAIGTFLLPTLRLTSIIVDSCSYPVVLLGHEQPVLRRVHICEEVASLSTPASLRLGTARLSTVAI